MGKVGQNFLQGVRSLFGKITSNETPVNMDIIQFNSTSGQWELVTGIIGNAVQSSSNVGVGEGIALPRVLDDLPFKTLVGGDSVNLIATPTVITINIPPSFITNAFSTQPIASEALRFLAVVALDTESATELDRVVVLPSAYRLAKLTVGISQNATTASTEIRVRKNQADGNQTITIPAGVTGIFQDLVNTDLFAATDLLNYSILKGVGGSITVTSISMEFVNLL